MTNNTWASFGSGLTFTESTLDQPIGGTSLGKGTHEGASLTGIEPMPNGLAGCRATFELDGLSKSDGIFFENFNKDGLNHMFISLMQSAIKDPSLRHKIVKMISNDASNLNKLVGNIKATIVIDYPQVKSLGRKYKIVNFGDSGYKIVDAFDETVEPEETEGTIFETAEEAREARKENNLQGLYLQIRAIKPYGTDEERAEQDNRLESLFLNKPKAVSSEGF